MASYKEPEYLVIQVMKGRLRKKPKVPFKKRECYIRLYRNSVAPENIIVTSSTQGGLEVEWSDLKAVVNLKQSPIVVFELFHAHKIAPDFNEGQVSVNIANIWRERQDGKIYGVTDSEYHEEDVFAEWFEVGKQGSSAAGELLVHIRGPREVEYETGIIPRPSFVALDIATASRKEEQIAQEQDTVEETRNGENVKGNGDKEGIRVRESLTDGARKEEEERMVVGSKR